MQRIISFLRGDRVYLGAALFAGLVLFHLWAVSLGWHSGYLPGNEFRQTQTAITAYFVQQEHNFSLAYPTPVLGKPWSVPFEFPLYQWVTVIVSNTVHLGLVESGRLVSVVCFYLTLPAVWLLLGRIRVERRDRWIVLGFVVSCPLYIFYARAFLIETMALMFSVWFLVAYISSVERRSAWWLALANLAGVGAGLVKVTTFIVFLLPAGIWTLAWLRESWFSQPTERLLAVRRRVLWAGAAATLPFIASYAWLNFADATKARNPIGSALLSSGMHDYNWGTWSTRLSPEIWAQHWNIHLSDIASLGVLVVALMIMVLAGGGWRPWIFGCLGVFFAAQALFPILYAWHEYYYVANAVLLMLAFGLGACGLLKSRLPAWLSWLIVLALHGGQIGLYFKTDYPRQMLINSGGNGLTRFLEEVTGSHDVLIIAGDDWASMIPYYSHRRALMLRRSTERDWQRIEPAFELLKTERVAALLLRGDQRENHRLRELANVFYGIEMTPSMTWADTEIYFQPALRDSVRTALRKSYHTEVFPTPTLMPVAEAHVEKDHWVKDLPAAQKALFAFMHPAPVRVYSQVGMALHVMHDQTVFLAHPETRLWFEVPAGRHVVHAEFTIATGAYSDPNPAEQTDGVEFLFEEERADGTRRHLFTRFLDPTHNVKDRGIKQVSLPVTLAQGSRIVLSTRPGPRNSYNHDWAGWGRIEIK